MIRREWRSRNSAGPTNARHADTLELCLVEQGSEVYDLEGRAAITPAGFYSLIPQGSLHSSWSEKQSNVQTIVHLPTRYLVDAATELGTRFEPSRFRTEQFVITPELAALASGLNRYIALPKAPAPRLLIASLISHLSRWLVWQHLLESPPPTRNIDLHAMQKVRNVEETMRATLNQSHSLDTLASAANLSRFHFLRVFHRVFGVTPHAHLLRLRVARAAELLRGTDLPVTAIAFELGFSSAGGLSTAFKKIYGQPPLKWRDAISRKR